MQKKYTVEVTSTDEKETFIHIYNCEHSVELCTSDYKVYNRMVTKLGEAHVVFPPVTKKGRDNSKYISGASWKYDYFKDREILKQIFSITNLLPRNK